MLCFKCFICIYTSLLCFVGLIHCCFVIFLLLLLWSVKLYIFYFTKNNCVISMIRYHHYALSRFPDL